MRLKMFSDVSGNEVVSVSLVQNQLVLSNNPQQKAIIFGNKALKLGGDGQSLEAKLNSFNDLQTYLIDNDTEARQQMIATVYGWFGQGNREVVIRDIGTNATALNDLDQNCYIAIAGYEWSDLSAANTLFATLVNQFNSNLKSCYGVGSIPISLYTNDKVSILKNIKSLFTIATTLTPENAQVGVGAIGYELSNYAPSTVNKVNSMTYRRLYNAAPLEDNDYIKNKSLQDQFNTNMLLNPPIDGSGAKSLVYPGILADGNDFTYWFGVDYIRFELISNITNLLIHGNNSKINPIYYNQDGIDRIKALVKQTITRCASYGIIQSNFTVSAIDFADYVTQNPNDYKQEIYGGISIEVSPLKALRRIKFVLQVTDLIAQ